MHPQNYLFQYKVIQLQLVVGAQELRLVLHLLVELETEVIIQYFQQLHLQEVVVEEDKEIQMHLQEVQEDQEVERMEVILTLALVTLHQLVHLKEKTEEHHQVHHIHPVEVVELEQQDLQVAHMDLDLLVEMAELEILFQHLLLDQQHLLMENQDQQEDILLEEVVEVNMVVAQEHLSEVVKVA